MAEFWALGAIDMHALQIPRPLDGVCNNPFETTSNFAT
jgi:hypothetical protein